MSITLLVPILERIAAALEERNAHERREARRSRRSMKKQAAMLEQMSGTVAENAARQAEEAAAFNARMDEARKRHIEEMAKMDEEFKAMGGINAPQPFRGKPQ